MKNPASARFLLPLILSAALTTPALAQHGAHSLPAVQIQGQDYQYSGPASVPAGWTTLEFRNTGQEPHHLQLVRLPDGMTQASFLAGLQANEGATLASVEMVGGVGMLLPGQSQQVTVNLSEPGTYLELCLIPDANGVPHLALGMVKTLQVAPAGAVQAQPPQADFQVKLVDYGFELPRGVTVTEGPQVWEIANDGPEGHEMTVFRLAPGKTMEDVNAYLKNPEGAMPLIPLGGAQAMAKGRVSYLHLDLAPGEYVMVCMVPSPGHQGAPHAVLGMLRPFTVAAKTAQR
ncbi:hypothetical protein ACFP9V_20265 [Deinococcus radiopugnans]|uniref:Cupredoxin-like copper-binding protein n=1 Tax=Deinococcus radiopugnans ATCC 19172 TaxID=585398 RepID=A0A5C4YBW9_9DEIO|nr:hypothetical protein [Deinococcus radiopugnans]MBB6015389.1 putative cupredoxin-like copper-binding protein [Deinococcus radiopugnans ATCC 19172]TNM72924.1 hypothetical protein FHR04_00385 [Deinococcus radiopugnans ATCC 19172]